MTRQQTKIYKGLIRGKIKEPSLQERKLSPEKILSLRYQCAVENKDFKAAEVLKMAIASLHSREIVSEARQQAEQLFKKGSNDV
jgi:hypothetical protein